MGREAHQLGCIVSLAFRFSLTSNKKPYGILLQQNLLSNFSFPSTSSHAFSLLLYLEKIIGTSDLEKFL